MQRKLQVIKMNSDEFCKNLVIDVAEMLFDDLMPEFTMIELEKRWENISSQDNFHRDGTLILRNKDYYVVGRIYFKVRYTFDEHDLCGLNRISRIIVAEPYHLELLLPDGTKHTKVVQHKRMNYIDTIQEAVDYIEKKKGEKAVALLKELQDQLWSDVDG